MPIQYPPSATLQTAQGPNLFVGLLKQIEDIKKKKAQEEQVRELIKSKGESLYGEPQAAEAQPGGLAGLLSTITEPFNPLAPHRGTTGLEELYAQKSLEKQLKPPTRTGQIGEYMAGQEPGSDEWYKAAAGGRGRQRTEADIWKEIASLKKAWETAPQGSAQEEMINRRLTELLSELTPPDMEIEEVPGTPSIPAKNPWYPFGIGSTSEIPAVPPSRKLVPRKKIESREVLSPGDTLSQDIRTREPRLQMAEEGPPTRVTPGLEGLGKRKFDMQTTPATKPKGKRVSLRKGKAKSGKGIKISFENSVKAQSAPDARLDAVWAKLQMKQRQAVWENEGKVRAALDNGYTIQEVLGTLGVK